MPPQTKPNETVEEQTDLEKAALEFENAIDATGFGLFNALLILVTIPTTCAIIFSTTVMSYVYTAMRCDVAVTTHDMGILNSSTYMGMIFGGLFWAVIADIKGRRLVILITHTLDAIFANLCALGQNVTYFAVFKFLCGFCMAGGYTTYTAYIAEIHSATKRNRMLFFVGSMLSFAVVIMPSLAWAVLPNYFKVTIIGINYTSWQLFMTLATIPSILVSIAFVFLPESPKYDQYHEKSDRAIATLNRIYNLNNLKKKDEYPISTLSPVKITSNIFEHLMEFKIIITRPYIFKVICLWAVEFSILIGQNTIRLWQPTLMVLLTKLHEEGVKDFTICTVFENVVASNQNPNIDKNVTCNYNPSPTIYAINVLLNCVSIISFFIAILVINYLGAKIILSISSVFMTIFAAFIIFAVGPVPVILMYAGCINFENIASLAIVAVTVGIIPTHVRAFVLSTTMLIGRIGSTISNFLFPVLMSLGCVPPISVLFLAGLTCLIVSIFIPDPRKILFL